MPSESLATDRQYPQQQSENSYLSKNRKIDKSKFRENFGQDPGTLGNKIQWVEELISLAMMPWMKYPNESPLLKALESLQAK